MLMKKVLRLNLRFVFSVLVILSSTFGVQRAQADPVGVFTGSWNVGPHGILIILSGAYTTSPRRQRA